MAEGEGRLTNPARLFKLELQPEELKAMVEDKMRAIWHGPLTRNMHNSLTEVCRKVCRRTNLADPSKSDRRRTLANDFFQEIGAAPDVESSPSAASQGKKSFVNALTKDYHQEQDSLFQLLQEDSKLDKQLSWKNGSLERVKTPLSFEELCNTLDEVTLTYFEELAPAKHTSITTSKDRRSELWKILDCCESILAARIYGGGTLEDDILAPRGYKAWKMHVNIIASFVALTVSLSNLLSP